MVQDPPLPSGAEFLETPKEVFGSKLIGVKVRKKNLAQSFEGWGCGSRGEGGGTPTPPNATPSGAELLKGALGRGRMV